VEGERERDGGVMRWEVRKEEGEKGDGEGGGGVEVLGNGSQAIPPLRTEESRGLEGCNLKKNGGESQRRD